MSILLNRLLEARGITDKEKLSATEANMYKKWEKVLTGELSIEDMEKAIRAEMTRLEEEWLAEESKNPFNYLFHWKKEVEIKARLKNYSLIIKIITNKQKEKDSLIKHIQELINLKS